MQYRTLGRTGISVSEIGLGCEHLQGQPYPVIEAAVNAALAQGMNILDIFMSEPEVRTDLGRALAGRRKQVLLQGHIGASRTDGQYTKSRELDVCKFYFEDFMQRLQTDYVDIGMIHFVDTEEDYKQVFEGDILPYVQKLKADGVVRCIGMSCHNPVIATRAVQTGAIDVLMFSLNPAYDLLPEDKTVDDLFLRESFDGLAGVNPVRAELYKTCEAMGTAVTVMKTLGVGTLLRAETSPFGVALTPEQCIHYALTRPAVASVLIGCVTPEEVEKAAAYDNASEEQRDYTAVLAGLPKWSTEGRCMYCNHCLPCPSRIDIAAVNKYLDLALIGQKVPETVRAHYGELAAHGSDCIACGSCEEICPFGVQVRQRMQKAAEVFGI